MEIVAALLWWEYILVGILAIAFIWGLTEESGLVAVIAISIFLAVSWTGVGTLGATLASASLGALIAGTLVYVGLGLLWSVFKWRLFVKKEKAIHIEDAERRGTKPNKERLKETIARKKDVDVISFWIILWPLSGIAYVAKDFIIDAIRNLIERMTTVYDKVTNSIIKDL